MPLGVSLLMEPMSPRWTWGRARHRNEGERLDQEPPLPFLWPTPPCISREASYTSDFQILQQQGCHGIDQASQSHFGEDAGVGLGTRQGRGEEMVALQGTSQWWFLWSLARTLSHQRVEVPGLPVSVRVLVQHAGSRALP